MKATHWIAALVVLSAACRKDPPPPVPLEDTGQGAFMIGDLTNATLLLVDDTLKGSMNSVRSRSLDVDQDGQPDIRFVIRMSYTLGGGQYGHAYIVPAHPAVGLTGFYTNDSSFVATTYTFFESSGPGYSVVRRKHVMHSCRPFLNAELSSVTPNRPRLQTFSPGDVFTAEEAFIADSVRLVQKQTASQLNNHGVVNDTLYTSHYSSSINCNAFPHGQLNYIGFRVEQSGQTVLGWIKFTVISDGWIALHQVAVRN